MVESNCPNDDLLENLLLGRLSLDEFETWEGHLSSCEECAMKAVHVHGSDKLIRAIQAPTIVDFNCGELKDLLQRGRQIFNATVAQAQDETAKFSADHEDLRNNRSYLAEDFSFLAPPRDDNELGQLGEYRVIRLLGQGGMGMVFLAEDSTLGRQVALKVMSHQLAGNQSARERFLREARAMAAVSSDYVVAIFQVGETNQIPFLAMPLLQGESLGERLKRQHKLAVEEISRIGTEVAMGLAAAHEQGLIHRDIKPDNIWLEAPTGRVKILDFGLARGGEDVNLTQSGSVLGTPRYMSPEQAEGSAIDHRTDLFSLGSVLYHAATGRLPFPGKSLASTLVAVARANPQPITSLRNDLPDPIAKLISELLQRDPDKRPQTAAQVAANFLALQKVEGLQCEADRSEDGIRIAKPTIFPSNSRAPFSNFRILAAVAFALLMVFALAAVIVHWKTEAGTVYVTIDSASDHPIPVFVKENSIEIEDPNDGKTISITVDRSNNQMHLQKEGFKTVARAFDLTSKDGRAISVRFEPAEEFAGLPSDASDKLAPETSPRTTVATAERAIAKWVISHGGSVQVQYGDEWRNENIATVGELPANDFFISKVTLHSVPDESDLEVLADLSREVEVWVPGTSISGHCFAFLASIPRLECINLQGCQNLDPAKLEHLARAQNLRRLLLLGSNLGNEIAELASDLPSISHIEFGNRLTRDGLKILAECPSVTEVGLLGCRLLTPSDFALLTSIPNLTTVSIDASQATPNVLTSLSNIPGLRTLRIQDTDNTHQLDVDALRALDSLEELDLSYNALTFSACEPLRQLPGLRRLGLRSTGLLGEEIVRLGIVLPNCRIDHDGGILESLVDRHVEQRQLLDWLTSVGGEANLVLEDSNALSLSASVDIPTENFFVQGVALHDASDADLRQFEELPGLGAVNLQGSPLSGIGLKSLSSPDRVADLEALFLEGCTNLEARHAHFLLKAPKLIYLHCQETPLGDELVDVALQLPRLGSLGLGENLTADGLLRLANHAEIGWLYFSERSRLEAPALEPLAKMANLHFLAIGANQTGRESLAVVSEFSALKTLRIRGPIEHLRDFVLLRNIEELELADQGSHPLDISPLTEMSWLKKISFNSNSSVSLSDIDDLHTSLSHCEIFWREGSLAPDLQQD